MDRGFAEALDYGVTTVVVSPGSANPFSGQIAAVKTWGRCVDRMVINPAIAMKCALGENPKEIYSRRSQTPTTRMATAAMIREQLRRAKRYMEDFARSERDSDFDPPEYDARCEALLPVLKKQMPLHIHAHRADDIFTALRIAREFDVPCVLIHATEAHLIAKEIARYRVPVLCGPIIASRGKPELREQTRKNPAVLVENGIEVGICTDHPELPQEFLLLSAALACREGLPPQRPCAPSRSPGENLGIADRVVARSGA
jgi:imidazolonepropionase-like amidohydrolase